jgi:hypothetical protein
VSLHATRGEDRTKKTARKKNEKEPLSFCSFEKPKILVFHSFTVSQTLVVGFGVRRLQRYAKGNSAPVDDALSMEKTATRPILICFETIFPCVINYGTQLARRHIPGPTPVRTKRKLLSLFLSLSLFRFSRSSTRKKPPAASCERRICTVCRGFGWTDLPPPILSPFSTSPL